MSRQLEENPSSLISGSCTQSTDNPKAGAMAASAPGPSGALAARAVTTAKAEPANELRKKPLSSLVLRLNKADRNLLDKLSRDYAESIVTILGKSLRLYRAIVEAVEQGGSLIMTRALSKTGSGSERDSNNVYETVIAVREQFADEGKTPIALNRVYINVSRGLKTERIAIRANPAFMEGLTDLENKTGLSKSSLLRDGMHLYNFVKREFEKLNTSFYIGNTLVEGI